MGVLSFGFRDGAEEAGEVFGDLGGEGGEWEVAKCGEAGVNGGEVGGVIDGIAIGEAGEFVSAMRGGKRHRRGVGFHEEAIEGEGAEDVAFGRLAVAEEVAVEGKIGAEGGEVAGEFDGAAVGVEEEAARGERVGTEDVGEGAPRVDAVNRDRKVAFGGEAKLPDEGFELFVERGAAEAG